MVEQILRQTGDQIEIRKRELELQEKNSDHEHEYLTAALAAQAEDLKHQRKHEGSQQLTRYVFSGLVIVVLLIFLGFCLYAGKDQFAQEFAKLVLYGGGGSVGGYWYGRARSDKSKATPGETGDDDNSAA